MIARQIIQHNLPEGESPSRVKYEAGVTLPVLFIPESGDAASKLCMAIGDDRFVVLSGKETTSHDPGEYLSGRWMRVFRPSEGISILATEDQ